MRAGAAMSELDKAVENIRAGIEKAYGFDPAKPDSEVTVLEGAQFRFATEAGEKILRMSKFRGAILIATDRRVVAVDQRGGVRQVIPTMRS